MNALQIRYLPEMEQENPVTTLLNLIERHAPRLLREGGGPLSEHIPHDGIKIPSADVRKMEHLVTPEALGGGGLSVQQCADETGYHYSTVCRLTRRRRRRLGISRVLHPDGVRV